ncbi:MAG: retropepsin-like aspartic protease, partial [Isosphaeraceae bacterium]
MSQSFGHKGLLAPALALAVLSSPVLAQEPAAEKAKEGAKGVVPFELLVSNHMVVSAKLNGKGPYRLIFDLGAPITLLSNRASEGAGVVKAAAPRSMLFAMRGEATVGTLEVGTLKAEKLPVIVLDHPALRALGGLLGKPLDGIIGYTFFARYRTTIDYQSKTMTFEPVDYEVKDLMRELPNRLAGPKVARTKVLAPAGLFGFSVGEPKGSDGESTGVPVLSVTPGSPAESAGL